jgi:hypothetical protein
MGSRDSKLKWSFDVFLAALDIHTGVQFFHDLLAAQSIDGGRGGVLLFGSCLSNATQSGCLTVEGLTLQHLCHAVSSTITIYQTLQWYPFYGDPCIVKPPLQLLTLSAYCHDVARSDGQKIVGIVHLVVIVYRDNVEAPALDILHKGLILLP